MSLVRERLGCGLVSRGLSRLLFYKKKMIGVFNAEEAWLWLGLPRSLSCSFFVKKKIIRVFNAGEGCLWLGLPRSLSCSFFVKNK